MSNFINFEKIFFEASNNDKYLWGIKQFEILLKKYPLLRRDEVFLSRLGLMYDHSVYKYPKRNYEQKARKIYKDILKLNPNSYKATWGLGRILWHKKDRRALSYALKAYKLIKKAKVPSGLYAQNVGAIYEVIGDLKNAKKWMKRGIQVEPNNWGVYLNIINFYRRIGEVEKITPFSKIFQKLLKKEKKEFFMTLWGKQVLEILEYAKKQGDR